MATFEWTGGAVEVPVGCYVSHDGMLHATEKADKVGTPLSTVDGDPRGFLGACVVDPLNLGT